MAKTTTRDCPCCDEEIELFICKKCKTPAVRNDEEECSGCAEDFCPDCIDDHDCGDGEDDEVEEHDERDEEG